MTIKVFIMKIKIIIFALADLILEGWNEIILHSLLITPKFRFNFVWNWISHHIFSLHDDSIIIWTQINVVFFYCSCISRILTDLIQTEDGWFPEWIIKQMLSGCVVHCSKPKLLHHHSNNVLISVRFLAEWRACFKKLKTKLPSLYKYQWTGLGPVTVQPPSTLWLGSYSLTSLAALVLIGLWRDVSCSQLFSI